MIQNRRIHFIDSLAVFSRDEEARVSSESRPEKA